MFAAGTQESQIWDNIMKAVSNMTVLTMLGQMTKTQVRGLNSKEVADQVGMTVGLAINDVLQFWSGFKKECTALKAANQEAYELTFLFALTGNPQIFSGLNQARFRIAKKVAETLSSPLMIAIQQFSLGWLLNNRTEGLLALPNGEKTHEVVTYRRKREFTIGTYNVGMKVDEEEKAIVQAENSEFIHGFIGNACIHGLVSKFSPTGLIEGTSFCLVNSDALNVNKP